MIELFTTKGERALYLSVGRLETWTDWDARGRYGWGLIRRNGTGTLYAGPFMFAWAWKTTQRPSAA